MPLIQIPELFAQSFYNCAHNRVKVWLTVTAHVHLMLTFSASSGIGRISIKLQLTGKSRLVSNQQVRG